VSSKNQPQFRAMRAWREDCAKKFSVSDNGAHCPDFSRDISIKSDDNTYALKSRQKA
jgi:hypothetical protein